MSPRPQGHEAFVTLFLFFLPCCTASGTALEPGFWFTVGSKSGGMNEGVAFGLAIAANFLLLFVLEAVRGRLNKKLYVNAATWGLFLILTAAGHLHSPNDASIYITVGAALQLLALSILVASARHGARFPPEFAALMAIALFVRVAVTVYDMGYLPNDETGDGCIQAIEAFTMLILLAGLLREVRWRDCWKWKLSCARFMKTLFLCSTLGFLCCGDKDINKDIGLLADEAYAAAVYMELAAWVSMAHYTMTCDIREVNPTWLLPAVIQAASRTYFWWASYRLDALKVEEPVLLQSCFPTVIVLVFVAMTSILLGMTVCANGDFLKSDPVLFAETEGKSPV